MAYCLGGDVRAEHRRKSIDRAFAMHRRAVARGDDPYPSALVLCQRLGVALEDLGRLVLALENLETGDAFAVLRGARLDDLDGVFERLLDDDAELRAAFRLPSPETTESLAPDLREALLAATEALTRRWSNHWSAGANGWLLLRRIAKAMRHGAPLIPREIVVESPGAGVLGKGLQDAFTRWVLVVDTTVDAPANAINSVYAAADLSDDTLARARQAGLEGVALARELAGAHVVRLRSTSVWALPSDVGRLVSPEYRRILHENARA